MLTNYNTQKIETVRALVTTILWLLLHQACATVDIGVYWGQDIGQGFLAGNCATGRYSYINIGFLSLFGGGGQTPHLNLAVYCDPATKSCRPISGDICACQNRGIKVMLSIGGGTSNYSLSSGEDARNLSVYLWNNFLGSNGSDTRPLGDAVLDGIDLDIEQGSPLYYDDLVRFLSSYSRNGRKVYISGAPQCLFPDYHLDAAPNTSLVDYVWVQFYNNPHCDGYVDNLKKSWTLWTSSINAGKIFLCLPTVPAAASGGFIPVEVLRKEVLPEIQRSTKFGGVMLRAGDYDDRTSYSAAMAESTPPVQSPSCPPPPQSESGNNFFDLGPFDPNRPGSYDPGRAGSSAPVGIIIGVVLGIICIICIITLRIIIIYWPDRPNQGRNQDVENILLQNGLAPKRYKYSKIKKITKSFKDKLGQGGYGSVCKGTLRDGSLVAVKVLIEADTDGEEFISEVASISRTSHVNIITLLGFCYEKNKRALVYEFMPNKSLDKFLSNSGTDCSLDLEKLYKIAVGIAKRLEYLHSGCSTRIVHFDIKPQNILLDENFCPRISDFGLAKLCKRKQSVVSLIGTRGTIGYIPPQVFSRNYGRVSHKSDVYSYGMMVLEMAGANKVAEPEESQLSENYFPEVYELATLDVYLDSFMIEEEEETRRKMILVGFWCIQTIPSERPDMSKVVEMLEGSLLSIQIPPKPVLFAPTQ